MVFNQLSGNAKSRQLILSNPFDSRVCQHSKANILVMMCSAKGTYTLKLYVVGNTQNSTLEIQRINDIFEQEFQGVYRLRVIDVLKSCQLTKEEKVLATPTLAKVLPSPVRKILDNLSNREKVLIGLDLL